MTNSANRTLIIRNVCQQASEIRSFDMALRNGARLDYKPGQVAVLRVGDEKPSYFAFASAPEDNELEFLIKRNEGVSAAIYDMQEGDHVELVDVVGAGYALEDHKGKDLVFVAMGTGVAPLRSALRQVLKHKDEYGQLVVLYGARTPMHFCYSEEAEGWEDAGVELRRVVSRPDGHDWSGSTGYVQSLLDHVLHDLESPVALICGSREMIGQTRDRLQQMGFAPDHILTNY
jgi:sulfhydrogenase subunit gamma (sulfur reductase)